MAPRSPLRVCPMRHSARRPTTRKARCKMTAAELPGESSARCHGASCRHALARVSCAPARQRNRSSVCARAPYGSPSAGSTPHQDRRAMRRPEQRHVSETISPMSIMRSLSAAGQWPGCGAVTDAGLVAPPTGHGKDYQSTEARHLHARAHRDRRPDARGRRSEDIARECIRTTRQQHGGACISSPSRRAVSVVS